MQLVFLLLFSCLFFSLQGKSLSLLSSPSCSWAFVSLFPTKPLLLSFFLQLLIGLAWPLQLTALPPSFFLAPHAAIFLLHHQGLRLSAQAPLPNFWVHAPGAVVKAVLLVLSTSLRLRCIFTTMSSLLILGAYEALPKACWVALQS